MASCAQEGQPSGGKKDQDPPEVVNAKPANYSTKVNPDKIEIAFNEFIKLKNKRKNILISPPIQNYQITGRRKTILIDIKDTLKSNVTYSIQFGASIRDITENNAKRGYEYVFSTGEQLDSLTLTGNIKDAFTLDSIPKSQVLIYRNAGDSVLKNNRPYYYTETDQTGAFKFNHLKKGEFQIFALQDLNGNLTYDGGEKVGFYPRRFFIQSDTVVGELLMFKQLLEKPGVVSAKMLKRGKAELKFNQPLDTFYFSIWNGKKEEDPVYWEIKEDGKLGIIWFEPKETQNLKFLGVLNGKYRDTILLERSKKYLDDPVNYDTGFKIKKVISKVKPGKGLNIWLNNPWEKIDFPSVEVFKDSNSISIKGPIPTNNPKKFVINGNFREDSTYLLRMDSGAFKDIYGNLLKPGKFEFEVISKSDLGLLEVNCRVNTGMKGQILIRLMDQNRNVLRKKRMLSKEKSLTFKKLNPGKYRLKAIIDENGNGFWDNGNVFERKMPEKVIFYPGSINVKANWEIKDVQFNISPR